MLQIERLAGGSNADDCGNGKYGAERAAENPGFRRSFCLLQKLSLLLVPFADAGFEDVYCTSGQALGPFQSTFQKVEYTLAKGR